MLFDLRSIGFTTEVSERNPAVSRGIPVFQMMYLRKSFKVEQIVAISTLDRFGAPLPFKNFSLRHLASAAAPFTLYNPCSFIPRNSTSLIQ